MNALVYEVEKNLQSVDLATATRLERLVRDALDLVKPFSQEVDLQQDRKSWIQRLDNLRSSVGTDRQGTSSEEILEDLRSDRCC